MNWIGKWKNQYGSILEISDDSDNRIVGTFRTALEDSGFFGQEIAIVGVSWPAPLGRKPEIATSRFSSDHEMRMP